MGTFAEPLLSYEFFINKTVTKLGVTKVLAKTEGSTLLPQTTVTGHDVGQFHTFLDLTPYNYSDDKHTHRDGPSRDCYTLHPRCFTK